MTAPLPDFSKDMELGRCISCKFWSGADNESRTLHSFACYTNPEAREEESENEALALLSPPPLDPATAYTRGWCKAASNYTDNNPLDLVVDPVTGAVGALISSQEYACVRYVESPNPLVKKTPDWRILLNRKKLHILGASAPLDALLCSYMDPAKLLDHNNPLSPLHEHHPLNPRNPKSLYLNPNPAFAAYVLNPSVVNTLTDTEAIRKGAEVGRPTGVVDSHHPRVSILFSADPSKDPSEAHRQMSMQARLAQDFAARTMRMEADLPLAPGVSVSLSKPGDTRIVDDDRRKTPASDKYRKTPATGGFVDRRRLPS